MKTIVQSHAIVNSGDFWIRAVAYSAYCESALSLSVLLWIGAVACIVYLESAL